MKCEIDQLTGKPCSNDPVANINVSGDKGSVTINVCLEHLQELTGQFPTNLCPEAQRQVKGWSAS